MAENEASTEKPQASSAAPAEAAGESKPPNADTAKSSGAPVRPASSPPQSRPSSGYGAAPREAAADAPTGEAVVVAVGAASSGGAKSTFSASTRSMTSTIKKPIRCANSSATAARSFLGVIPVLALNTNGY